MSIRVGDVNGSVGCKECLQNEITGTLCRIRQNVLLEQPIPSYCNVGSSCVCSAFCKNPITGCWYSYNDEKVEEIKSDSAVVTNAAYLLFYRRRFPRTDRCDTSLSRWIEAVMSAAYTDLQITEPHPAKKTTSALTGSS